MVNGLLPHITKLGEKGVKIMSFGWLLISYWPQLVYIFLLLFGFFYTLGHYGKPKGNYDWTDLLGIIIMVFILYFGHFFS